MWQGVIKHVDLPGFLLMSIFSLMTMTMNMKRYSIRMEGTEILRNRANICVP